MLIKGVLPISVVKFLIYGKLDLSLAYVSVLAFDIKETYCSSSVQFKIPFLLIKGVLPISVVKFIREN